MRQNCFMLRMRFCGAHGGARDHVSTLLIVLPWKARGFILVTSLLLTTLITALVLAMLQVGFLQIKMSHNFMQGEDRSVIVHAALNQVIQNNMQHTSSCLFQKVSSVSLEKQPYAWWESSATCHGRYHDHAFQYVIESLQEAPCLIDAHKHALRYARVTLRYPLKNGLSDVLVQETFLKLEKHPLNDPGECASQQMITTLAQSWRLLR